MVDGNYLFAGGYPWAASVSISAIEIVEPCPHVSNMRARVNTGGGLAEKQQGDLVGVTGNLCLADVLFGKPCHWSA